jgi:hypothetical protein
VRQGPEHGMSRPHPVPLRGFILGPSPARTSLVGAPWPDRRREEAADRRSQAGQNQVQAGRHARDWVKREPIGMIRRKTIEQREMKMSRGTGQPKTNAGRSGRRYSLGDAAGLWPVEARQFLNLIFFFSDLEA